MSKSPHWLAMIAVLVAAAGVLWSGSYIASTSSMVICAALLVLFGKWDAALKLVLALTILFVSATLLWTLVGIEFQNPLFFDAVTNALNSPNLRQMCSALAGAFWLSVGVAMVEDGDLYFQLRSMRLPHSLSVIAVSGVSGSASLGASALKVQNALVAQKFFDRGYIGRIRGLALIMGSAWVSALSESLNRYDLKWSLSGFEKHVQTINSQRPFSFWKTATVVLAVFGAIAIVVSS